MLFVDVSVEVFFVDCFRGGFRVAVVLSPILVLQSIFIKGFVFRHFWAGERRVKVRFFFYSFELLFCHL